MSIYGATVAGASMDAVAVLGQESFGQMFPLARQMKVSARVESKLMEHPLENGATIVDHRVILPKAIELSLFLESGNYRDTYQQIQAAFEAGTLLIVQTRASSFTNLVIEAMPHDEDPTTFDSIVLSLRLKEAKFITPSYGTLPPRKTANKSQASTVKKGQQQTTKTDADSAAGRKSSTLYRILN